MVRLNSAGKPGTSCYPKSICGGDSQGRPTGLLPGPMESVKFCPFGSKDPQDKLKGDCLAGLPEDSARSGREQRYSGLLMLKGCGTETKWGEPDRTFGPTLVRSALFVTGGVMSKIIQDPINGPIKVDGLIEELIDSPEFQRLRYIKQLGLLNLVFPGANHTRFDHSLGTYYIASLIGDYFHIENRETLLSAALLHDIGHPPMSHSLEDLFLKEYGKDHQGVGGSIISGRGEYSGSSIPAILEKYSADPSLVGQVVEKGSKRLPLISSIISGSIDADELDYLRRDAFFTGVAIGLVDHMRIINTVRIVGGEFVIEEKGIPSAESLLISRVLMYNSVYFHKTGRIAQNMLGIALSLAEQKPVDPFEMNDWEFIEFLRHQDGSSRIIDDILKRRLFKRVAQYNFSNARLDELNHVLENADRSTFIVDVIPPLSFSGKDRIKSEIKAIRGGNIGQLESFSPLVRSLSETLETRNIIISARQDSVGGIEHLLRQIS
ncbi:HD domain protein [Thermoplasmatales archaeon]|nr:HD domain protein [Thermoplasmatales archaeon]